MNNRWSTPADLFDKLNKEFAFKIDVCAEEWNHKCDMYFSPDEDGLSKDWTGTAWMNPPYGHEIKHWIRKAYNESLKGITVVCLVPARTETSWFQDYCLKGEVRFLRGRIHFSDIGGKTGRPRFGSAIIIFRPEVDCIGCDYEDAFPGCPTSVYCGIHMEKKRKENDSRL